MDHKDSADPQPTQSKEGPPATDQPASSPARRRNWLELSPVQVIGGALAASTAAAAGSRLGLAGTISGAALISIISAIAAALYTHSINRTRHGVQKAVVVVKEKGIRSPGPVARAAFDGVLRGGTEGEIARGEAILVEQAETGTTDGAARPPARSRLRVAAMGLGAAAIFGIALLAVTGFELATGRPLSGGGGTSLSQLLDGRSGAGEGTVEPAPASSPATESAPPTTSSAPESASSSTTPTPTSTTPSPSSSAESSSSAPSSSSVPPSSEVVTPSEPSAPGEVPGDPAAQ